MYYTTNAYDSMSLFTHILAIISAYIFFIIGLSIFIMICNWKIYKKAGKEGWKSIIPIYNIFVLVEIVELPWYFALLYFVPFINIYAAFKVYIELAHKFGKSTGFGIATVFFSIICLPILAFGKSMYESDSYQQPIQSMQNMQPQQAVQSMQNMQPQQAVQSMQSMQPQQAVQSMQGMQPQQTVQSMQGMQPQQTINKKVCPNCGNQVDINNTACFMCGKQF